MVYHYRVGRDRGIQWTVSQIAFERQSNDPKRSSKLHHRDYCIICRMQSRVTSYAARRFGRFGSCTIWWALSKICCICSTASCSFSASCMTWRAGIDTVQIRCACPKSSMTGTECTFHLAPTGPLINRRCKNHLSRGCFHGSRQSQPASGTAIRICFKCCAISFTVLEFVIIFCTSKFAHYGIHLLQSHLVKKRNGICQTVRAYW